MSIVKIIVVLLLIAVIASMVSSLFYLMRDKGDSKRMVRALTLRVALSIAIFVILMLAYATGLITPNASG